MQRGGANGGMMVGWGGGGHNNPLSLMEMIH